MKKIKIPFLISKVIMVLWVGDFAPETLMALLAQLESQYRAIKKDKTFKKEFEFYLKEYAGRPTNLYWPNA